MLRALLSLFAIAAAVASAQSGRRTWELGAIGGYAFSPSLDVKGPSRSASTGFRNGAAIGAFAGHDTYERWSGEARYLYRFSDLKLSSGGTDVRFGARTHIMTGVVVWHFSPRASVVRPFVAFGGGVKVIEGTGKESAAQPLGSLAALTHTMETLGTADAGVGVKIKISNAIQVRVEARDYISERPKKVIAAAPGTKISGVMNDIQGLAGISYTW